MGEPTLYNPANLREDDLIANFVVRTKTFEKIFKDIRTSVMRYPEKHYLIQGQRGMGKTTLLLRLKYEVARTEELKDWLVPVFFNEETYDVTSLSSLWERILRYLDEYFDTNGEYYDYTEQFVDKEDYERLCFKFLIEKLHEREKKLIIFFDNFGELFLDNLREKEKRRLREILIECNDIRIIGASAVVINDLHDYSQPFFEFFHIIYLDGLTKEETYELISKLQEDCPQARRIDIKRHKAKIDTLAVLTGGVIRTIMMLYQVLLDDPNGKALEDLEKVLDKATPLYKHRIEDLPTQQRRIVDVIAKKWDAVSAKEIAAEIREDGKKAQTKLISAQLAQLEKNNVVEKKATTTKNHLYQLKERFFNIWYLMRNGDRRDRKRVARLTKFLEMWYDDEDSFDAFVKSHISSLRSGKYAPASALLLVDALVNSDKFDPNKLDDLIEETSNVLREEERKYLPNLENRKISLALRSYKEENLERAINLLSNVRKTEAYLLLSKIFTDLQQIEEAKAVLDKIDQISNEWLNLLFLLCNSLNYYDALFRIVEVSTDLKPEHKEQVLGDAYLNQQVWDLALEHYYKALDLGMDQVLKKIKFIYELKGDWKKTEEVLIHGVEKGVISRGELYTFLAFTKEDFTSLAEWLSNAPKDGDYYFFKGFSALEKQDRKGDLNINITSSYFRKAVDLYAKHDPNNVLREIAYSFLLIGLIEEVKDLSASKELLMEIESYDIITSSKPLKLIKAFILIWEGGYYSEYIEQLFNDVDKDHYDVFNDVLILLLSRHQYHLLYNNFEKYPTLKELFKPTYYALMTLLKDEMPNEIIKMGEELKVPVEEILQKVKQMKVAYKLN
ncbi:hypothetical protein FAZ15_01510 [Sphingobacterium olei]|uniref:Uncharacterized protein n=1 Tax=Sphingobacterium olei TaxID=2571155 RepID=A0A4U0P885_9SPHI|nr:ATP-binding protein [Sphingobacterium olei]TJZ63002.1 hypothetical protein FAZ15_01510 [Sphingobacterium olei]